MKIIYSLAPYLTNRLTTFTAFSALAFFSGTIYNRIGIKLCLAFGGLGYACLASAYLTTSLIGERATPWIVIAGCLEGLSAAMVRNDAISIFTATQGMLSFFLWQLWTSQGAVTMCYPTEEMKGRSFCVFWTIFEMGGVIGSIIPICMNWNSDADNLGVGSVSNIYTHICALFFFITFNLCTGYQTLLIIYFLKNSM